MDRSARLQLFYARLSVAPAASTHNGAYTLICEILNAVEDEHSGLPNNPSWERDGRMYPQELDSVRPVNNFAGLLRYRSFSHNTFIATNGEIEVRKIATEEIEFTKAGANGKGVWDV